MVKRNNQESASLSENESTSSSNSRNDSGEEFHQKDSGKSRNSTNCSRINRINYLFKKTASALKKDLQGAREVLSQVSSLQIDLHKCPSCTESFNDNKKVPVELPCGHFLCCTCCVDFKHCRFSTVCPKDNLHHFSSIKKLPVNQAILKSLGNTNLCQSHSLEIVGFCIESQSLICGKCILENKNCNFLEIQDSSRILTPKVHNYFSELEKLQQMVHCVRGAVFDQVCKFKDAEKKLIANVKSNTQVILDSLTEHLRILPEGFKQATQSVISALETRNQQLKYLVLEFKNFSRLEQLSLDSPNVQKKSMRSLRNLSNLAMGLKRIKDYEQIILDFQNLSFNSSSNKDE